MLSQEITEVIVILSCSNFNARDVIFLKDSSNNQIYIETK